MKVWDEDEGTRLGAAAQRSSGERWMSFKDVDVRLVAVVSRDTYGHGGLRDIWQVVDSSKILHRRYVSIGGMAFDVPEICPPESKTSKTSKVNPLGTRMPQQGTKTSRARLDAYFYEGFAGCCVSLCGRILCSCD